MSYKLHREYIINYDTKDIINNSCIVPKHARVQLQIKFMLSLAFRLSLLSGRLFSERSYCTYACHACRGRNNTIMLMAILKAELTIQYTSIYIILILAESILHRLYN